MKLTDLNPYLRYAQLQPSVMSSYPLSCAYDHRIFYIVEGNADFVLENKKIPLSAGTLIYFPSGTPYYFDGGVKVIVLNFDMSRDNENISAPLSPSSDVNSFDGNKIIETNLPSELQNVIIIERSFEAEAKLQECLKHYLYPSCVSDSLSSAIIKELLCQVVEAKSEKKPKTPELIQNISLYIQRNYDKELSNDKISAEFGYHSFYINRVFKKHMGITLHKAVIMEKIKVAKRLLSATSLSVNSVSLEVGIADRGQFCTLFRKYTGYTPLEFREKSGDTQTALLHL